VALPIKRNSDAIRWNEVIVLMLSMSSYYVCMHVCMYDPHAYASR